MFNRTTWIRFLMANPFYSYIGFFDFTEFVLTVDLMRPLMKTKCKIKLVRGIDKLSYWYLCCAVRMQFPNNSRYGVHWWTWLECVTYYFESETIEMLKSIPLEFSWYLLVILHWIIKKFGSINRLNLSLVKLVVNVNW